MKAWRNRLMLAVLGIALAGCAEFYGTPPGYEPLDVKRPAGTGRTTSSMDMPSSAPEGHRTTPDSGNWNNSESAARVFAGATGATQVDIDTTRLSLAGRGPDRIGWVFADAEFWAGAPLPLGPDEV